MTPCSAIVDHMASGVGNIDVGDMLKQVVIISNIFTRGATLFNFVVIYSGSKLQTGAKFDVYNCLVMAALCNRTGRYIFARWFLSIFYLFFPRLISAVADWMSTILRHMVWP